MIKLILAVLLCSSLNPSIGEQIAVLDFVGDISFDGHQKYFHKKGLCPYNNTFVKVVSLLNQSDLVIGNLESAFVSDDMKKDEAQDFFPLISADPESIDALNYAGFNIMSLATNHLNDYKTKPINFTVNLLRKHGIRSFGYNEGRLDEERPQTALTTEVNGIKIGFLGYCSTARRKLSNGKVFRHCIEKRRNLDAGPSIYTDQAATRDVKRLKDKVDIIVVVMHWGVELNTVPTKRQQRQASHLKSLGVNVVIGHHPHVLEGHTISENFLVSYSLGNFVFGTTNTNRMFYYGKEPPKNQLREYERYLLSSKAEAIIDQASRLLRVFLNKKGIKGAAYLPLRIRMDPNTKCLQPTPIDNAGWISVCSSKDKACL